MAVVAFYTPGKRETGNTVSSVALATYIGVERNKRNLLISTSFNENTIRESLWPVQTKKRSGLFGPNTSTLAQNGIEGLDRIVRSNRITPNIISDYTRVALKDRLEVLLGYNGDIEQYKEIQQQYPQIVSLADRCYDTVFVDIDKKLNPNVKKEILKLADIVVAMTTQRADDINQLVNAMDEGTILKQKNTLLTIGKYDDKLKYNAKNISRNILRQKDIINTIPYNSLLFEAVQEGQTIDLFLKLLNLKSKDENTFFVEELKRLDESIENRKMELQMKK